MNQPLTRILVWTPRILGILFVLFISMFSLDVFDAGYGFWETVLALFMHLLLPIGLAIGLALAWRWEWVGAVIFLGFAAWYMVFMGASQHISSILLIGGPCLLVGGLFALDWFHRRKIRAA